MADQNLKMRFSSRERLIRCLNLLSAVLQSRQTVPEEAKKRINKLVDDSVQLLMDLSSSDPAPLVNDSRLFEELLSDQMIIEISKTERRILVLQLVENKDAFDGAMTEKDREKLASANRKITNELLNKPIKESGTSEFVEAANESSPAVDDLPDQAGGAKRGEPHFKKQKGK